MTSTQSNPVKKPYQNKNGKFILTFRGNRVPTQKIYTPKMVQSRKIPRQSLIGVEIREGVNKCGSENFSGSSIKFISFPSTMTTIESGSFNGCHKLENITICGNTVVKPLAFHSSCTKCYMTVFVENTVVIKENAFPVGTKIVIIN